ncbi:2-keto-4-pentenoate hydratase [Caldimonas thermodepolymerans]|jgi:2-keto-4-pentenoate hydratase|uniref:2-keto-4-pentenoate hydratase n=1 Tax=Caldimonas thermodepolymerans TaxID=215580 RepID=A0AA46DAU0_9BURK|nr:2-keto-4-pentenoate hydratase [Caldimonas thermodepolymerans]QPC31520.1 2-keto-4-pentenoate hydratase [Caldimonas thermodepolymerans]RDH95132.1 2-keto-4-pentenoate hydratase [Caldimonas thermodepolymerans]TCP03243.1 2-keto-4-pentenoate hydratase [Caldimonas thermodepolymerans]UZG47938.1 2-keto-4-pentenoate hydratase [Caldimonas thermodepolymerans]
MLTPEQREQAASLLRQAAQSGQPVAPLREQFPALDADDAYAIQRINHERQQAAGARVVGAKIGLTSPAVQKQLGVDQPDFGLLFEDMERHEGLPIPMQGLLQPKIEAEVAFVLGRDITTEQPTLVDVMRAVEFVLPALEIVDSRIADWNIRFVDTVADNASSAAYVIGGTPVSLTGLNLRECKMRLTAGDEEASRGAGSACLGHPLNAVVWLARTLAQKGTPLRAGQLVLSGALGPMVKVTPGTTYRADIEGLGSVSASFADQ